MKKDYLTALPSPPRSLSITRYEQMRRFTEVNKKLLDGAFFAKAERVLGTDNYEWEKFAEMQDRDPAYRIGLPYWRPHIFIGILGVFNIIAAIFFQAIGSIVLGFLFIIVYAILTIKEKK